MNTHRLAAAVVAVTATAVLLVGIASAKNLSAWAQAQKIDEIGEQRRPEHRGARRLPDPVSGRAQPLHGVQPAGGHGLLDIWVAHRSSLGEPRPVNLPAHQLRGGRLLPTPVRGRTLLRQPEGCLRPHVRLGDIYFRINPAHGWSDPEHLACAPVGPNTALDEQGPSTSRRTEAGSCTSRARASPRRGGFVPGDIYASTEETDGTFGPHRSSAARRRDGGGDTRQRHPADVRKDGREIVLSSDRSGTLGGQDVYVATRDTTADPWSAPVNLGAAVNSSAGETRPSLSWHGERLLFGRAGPVGTAEGGTGASDIYVATREKNGK